MILQERKYQESEFDQLVLDLMTTPDIDSEFEFCNKYLLLQNPNFYYYLLKSATNLKESDQSNEEQTQVRSFDEFILLTDKYKNIVIDDLPESFLTDSNFIKSWLSDDRSLARSQSELLEFQIAIDTKINSIPNKYKFKFLQWCQKMLDMNYNNHKVVCSNPINCSTNKGYELRLLYLEKLIDDETATLEIKTVIIPQSQPKQESKGLKKIEWLGNQKELAELFIQLKAKGWISDFEPETINTCFTKAKTIYQYLKPGDYTEDLGGTFDQVFTSEYVPNFRAIKTNLKN